MFTLVVYLALGLLSRDVPMLALVVYLALELIYAVSRIDCFLAHFFVDILHEARVDLRL
jgi:hypothetical protein